MGLLIKKATDHITVSSIKVLLYGQPGVRKAQPLTSKVSTPNGFVEIGSLKPGSVVFGLDGQPQVVLGVYPQGIRPVYKITTNDGATTLCDEEHLWLVRRAAGNSRKAGWKALTLAEIMAKGILNQGSAARQSSGRKPMPNWELPLCEAVEYPAKQFVIEPYTLGALIGDGYLCGKTVTLSNADIDNHILKKVSETLPENFEVHKHSGPACPQYNITHKRSKETGKFNPYRQEIVRLGLNVKSGEKFIPAEYMEASVYQRMQLLQGLMDTDGTALNNRVSYSTTSEKLAEDVVLLVRSLGGIAKVKVYNDSKCIIYVVNVKTPFNPFSLARKGDHWKPSIISRYIQSAERVADQECVCIKVSNANELYLTDNYIVTHNTSYSFSAPAALLVDCDNGIRRVAPEFRGDYTPVTGWTDLLSLLDDPDVRKYKTLVFDTVSKMMDMCGAYVMQKDIKNKAKDGSLSLKGFGALGTEFKNFVGRLSLLGINLVFVAHDKEAKVGDETIIRPDVTGQSLGVLIKDMDLVGYVQMFNNQSVVCFSPTDRFYGKNTAGLPDQIRTGEMKLSDIFALYEQKVNEGSQDLKVLNEQMTQVETILANVTTCEELNDAIENILAIPFVLTGKTQASQMVKTKSEDLSCGWDKDKKIYTTKAPADASPVSTVSEPA